MPLETATYTADLVASNPAASDPVSTTDDHLRTIKGAIKATFPNFTSAPLNSTQAQLDAAVASVTVNGVGVLADAGAFFKTNTTDGITNPVAGELDIKLAGVVAARFLSTGLSITGGLTTTTAIVGPGVVPIGGMIMWLTDTLPTVGTWCWANGATLSRTGNGAALFALTGTAYGVGDNSTTFNVINMQEVSPIGRSQMGGVTEPGFLTSVSTAFKRVLGAVFGEDTHTLTITEMPNHDHTASSTDSGHTHAVDTHTNLGPSTQVSNPTQSCVSPGGTSGTGFAVITTVVNSRGGSGAHNNLSPVRVVNFIIRIG